MFEEQTFENIMSRMLANESLDAVDKREGSIIYDALAPAAVEIAQLYAALGIVFEEFDITTASRGYLIGHGSDYDILPYEATAEIVRAKFTPLTIDVMGKTFSFDDRNYVVTEKVSDGVYLLKCTAVGYDNTAKTGNLLPVDEITGLESAVLMGTETFGSDEESTEEYRARLLRNIRIPAFGGNVTDYENNVLSAGGVGMVKVTPCNNGEESTPGHVLVEILDDNYEIPSDELCDAIQKTLAGSSDGDGYGIAPIGHCVHVQAPKTSEIILRPYLTFDVENNGADFTDEQKAEKTEAAKSVLGEYFAQIRDEWFARKNPTNTSISTLAMIAQFLSIEDVKEILFLDIEVDGEVQELYNNWRGDKNLIPYFNVGGGKLPVLSDIEIVFEGYSSLF